MRQFTSDFKWNLKRGLHGDGVHAVINVQKGLIYLLYMVPVGLLLFALSRKISKNLLEELRHVTNRVGTLQNGDISDNLGNSYATYFLVGWVKD